MRVNNFGDLIADPHYRTERKAWLLRDLRNPRATSLSQFPFGESKEVLRFKFERASANTRVLGQEPKHGLGERRLSAATFAEEPNDFRGLNLKRRASQRVDWRVR